MLRKSVGANSASSVFAAVLLVATTLTGGTLGLSHSALAAEPAKDSEAPSIGTYTHLRLLTTQQYLNTIQNLFGPDITVDAKFAPLPRTDGLLMAGTSTAGVSDAQLEQYQKIASLLSTQVVDAQHRDSLIPCKPADEKAADNACAGKFLTRVIDNLYFVPPPKEDVVGLIEEAGAAANRMHSFYGGLQTALEGVLMSPDVLLVAESAEPDPKHPGHMRLDAASQAARLSLFLWNAAPDPTLRAAAKRGDLFDGKKRAHLVDAMLASPRLQAGVRSFFDDMLGLDGLASLSKDPTVYPYFLGGVAAQAREQTLRTIVDLLLNENGDYRDIFTSRKTFISPDLAVLYGLPGAPGWRAYEFPPEAHRPGILTEASFLALNSQTTRSSATERGKALRELILCERVPPPPPNVDFSAVDNPPANLKTARQQLDFHHKNPVCAGCHRLMDPIGLSLENFDGAGRYRTDEKGAPIDAGGGFDGKKFVDIEGFAQAVHDDPAVPPCLVRRAFTYATAGVVPPEDNAVLTHLNKTFADAHYRLRPLLRAIALSPAFSEVIDPSPAAAPLQTASAAPATKVASGR